MYPEQLKKDFPFQREEPDGREEDSSCGQRMLSMFLDNQPDSLHNRSAAADEYWNPDSTSCRMSPFDVGEL